VTIAQAIIDAAIASSLANDAGRTDLADDTTELLNVLNRKLKQVYTLAGMPKRFGGAGDGDYFAASAVVVVTGAPVTLPAAAFRHTIVNAGGQPVSVVPRRDLIEGIAETPPAIVIEQQKLVSAGRAGDPVPGDQLTVRYTPMPGTLTLGTHYIGAVTPTDPTTSIWPDWVGDPFLVAWLARYLAIKASDRDADEMQALTNDLTEAATLLSTIIGVDATRLVETNEA
jgi:hypothetical protein